MKELICLITAICLTASIWGTSEARTNHAEHNVAVTITDDRPGLEYAAASAETFSHDLHIGALWFPGVSSKGYIGYYDISGFYPGGGDQSAVWSAGLWAGGYVEGGGNPWMFNGVYGHSSDPYQYDTLNEEPVLETESDLGLPFPYRRLTLHVNTADKPYTVSGSDTLDGDMGMDVTFEWHQWGVRGYDHWVFVHVMIGFTKEIDDFYWAWLGDCDCGDVNVPAYYYDDYAGWDDGLKFCYMRDWDYDPASGQPPAPSTEDSLFLSPNAVGQHLLAAPPAGGPVAVDPDTAQKWVTKNYWSWNDDISSARDAYDRMTGAWENPFPSPEPFDYRILNGVGPYDVSAGDTAHFWMAYVLGEGYDDTSHELYGLGTLVEHIEDAQAFFNGGMAIPPGLTPPRAPDLDPDIDVDVIGDTLRLHWALYENIPGGVTADSFIVYTSTAGKLGPWESFARFDNSVTEMKYGLTTACTYFWVAAYDMGNGIGSNPYALTSRLYDRPYGGPIRANENSIICVASPYAGVTPGPQPAARLIGNYPNPFGSATTLVYTVSLPAEVTLRIYDVSGGLVRTLADGPKTVGEYRLCWDGLDAKGAEVAPGVYFLRLEAGEQVTTRTVVLLK